MSGYPNVRSLKPMNSKWITIVVRIYGQNGRKEIDYIPVNIISSKFESITFRTSDNKEVGVNGKFIISPHSKLTEDCGIIIGKWTLSTGTEKPLVKDILRLRIRGNLAAIYV